MEYDTRRHLYDFVRGFHNFDRREHFIAHSLWTENIKTIMDSCWIGNGKKCKKFEKRQGIEYKINE